MTLREGPASAAGSDFLLVCMPQPQIACGHAGCAALRDAVKAYHLNAYIGNNPAGVLRSRVHERGLRPGEEGELALLSIWWARSPPRTNTWKAQGYLNAFLSEMFESLVTPISSLFADWSSNLEGHSANDVSASASPSKHARTTSASASSCGGQAAFSPKRRAKAKAKQRFMKRTAVYGRRGVIEMCGQGLVPKLDDKRYLALLLTSCGASHWHPQTYLTPDDLEKGGQEGIPGAEALWFLKHAHMNLNKGVTCWKGRMACWNAWMQMKEEHRSNYVAQSEVKNVLLDDLGRKLVLRVYALLVIATSPEGEGGDARDGTAAWALLRKEFLCKAHGMAYDPADPAPERHIYSSLTSASGDAINWCAGSEWPMRDKVWAEIRTMLAHCLAPLLPMAASAVPAGSDGARGLAFELLGVDVLVDTSLRPWLIEINTCPDVKPIPEQPRISQLRADVVEDVIAATVDPALHTGCLRGQRQTTAWEALAEWSEGQPLPMAASAAQQDVVQQWSECVLPFLKPGWSDGSEGTASLSAMLTASLS